MHQLLYNSNIIIDLQPDITSAAEFVKRYGFTVQQIAALARAGKVCLNLLAYDSTKPHFQGYLNFSSDDKKDEAAYVQLFR